MLDCIHCYGQSRPFSVLLVQTRAIKTICLCDIMVLYGDFSRQISKFNKIQDSLQRMSGNVTCNTIIPHEYHNQHNVLSCRNARSSVLWNSISSHTNDNYLAINGDNLKVSSRWNNASWWHPGRLGSHT